MDRENADRTTSGQNKISSRTRNTSPTGSVSAAATHDAVSEAGAGLPSEPSAHHGALAAPMIGAGQSIIRAPRAEHRRAE